MRQSNIRRASFLVLAVLTFLVANGHVSAADKTHSLFELVGSDVGLFVELTNLRDEVPKFKGAEVFQRVQQTHFYQKWIDSPGFQKLLGVRTIVENITQKPIGKMAAELFGESVVLAIYPRQDGEASAIFLTQTQTSASLESALALWNQSKSVSIAEFKYHGHQYVRRTESKANGDQTEIQFYTVIGQTFAVSDREGMIHRAIALAKRSTADGAAATSVLELSTYQHARKNVPDSAVAFAFFNPRAWDAAVAEGNLEDPALTRMWPRFESATASVTLERGIIIDAVVHYRGEGLPDAWSRFLHKTSGAAEFVKHVPDRAVAVFAGRYDPGVIGGMLGMLTKGLPERDKQQFASFRRVMQGLLLGRDLFGDVLVWFEPNWGAYAVPRQKLVEGAVPLDGLIAFQIPAAGPQDQNAQDSLRAALDNGLTTGLNFLAAIYNGRKNIEPATVRVDPTESGTIRWMDSYDAYRPAYCLTKQYLVLSSSPDLISEFLKGSRQDNLASSRQFQGESDRFFPDENQILFVNLLNARQFLSENRQFFIDQAVKSRSVSDAAAAEKISRLEELSRIFDSAFVAARAEPRRIRIVAGAVVRQSNSAPAR